LKSVPNIPRYIHLYDGTTVENFNIQEIRSYLGQWFALDRIQIRGEFVQHNVGGQEQVPETIAEDLAKAYVEMPEGPASNTLYDGSVVQRIYADLIDEKENSSDHLHIAFTDKLIGTWDAGGRRYHARVSIYGWPSIISTIGVVEAPAKPRAYYFGLMAGLDEKLLREELSGRFIDYGEARLTELLKGYTMQAVFYHLSAEPFCDHPDCRLFNAHWQKEMIRAQLTSPEDFCNNHREVLREIRSYREQT